MWWAMHSFPINNGNHCKFLKMGSGVTTFVLLKDNVCSSIEDVLDQWRPALER